MGPANHLIEQERSTVMHLLRRTIPLVIATAILAACSSPTATAPASSQGVASANPSVDGSSSAPSASSRGVTAEPIPSEELGSFSCELPFVEQATVPKANITDVRVGSHEGFDRVVFEFTDGLPEMTLDRAEGPFLADGSGMPIDVEGESFLRLTMRGGTKQMDDGTSSYDGSTNFDPGFPMLVDLVEGGDFEAQSTWYLGLASEACVRVELLDNEPRLVIDIEH